MTTRPQTKRSAFSIILLTSLLVGGLLGPVGHLIWMRYSAESSHAMNANPHDQMAAHSSSIDLEYDRVLVRGALASGALVRGALVSETQKHDPDCLFLTLLASQASAVSTDFSFSFQTPESPHNFSDFSVEPFTHRGSLSAARAPPKEHFVTLA